MRGLGLLLLLLGQALRGAGQAVPVVPAAAAAATGWQATFFEAPEVALPRLVAAAMQHSAELEALKTDMAMSKEDLQMARKAILGSVLLANNFGYGNIASVTVADQTVPNTGTGTTSSQTHYSTGINLNFSLDRLASRHNLINRQKLQYQKFDQVRQGREAGLRLQIIDLYQTVRLARKVLALRQQSYYIAQINYQLGEKQFKAGEVLLSEVSQLNDRYTNAAIEQENASSKYATTFMVLEDLVGNNIAELLTAPAPGIVPAPTSLK
jgi:outer membrane protein TolC